MKTPKRKIVAPQNPQGLIPGDDLSHLLNAATPESEKKVDPDKEILLLDPDSILEDPNQPRRADNPGFSEESIQGLADSIYSQGLKTPISVRHTPDGKQHMLNHGARRRRSFKIAFVQAVANNNTDAIERMDGGKIRAILDENYSLEAQLIENLQREDLTAMEKAATVGKLLAQGKKRVEIAKAVGKSPAWVSQYAALLSLPEPIEAAFNTGRINDVTVVADVLRVYNDKTNPASKTAVTEWLTGDTVEITRTDVGQFQEFMAQSAGNSPASPPPALPRLEAVDEPVELKRPQKREADPEKLVRAILRVGVSGEGYKGMEGALLFRRRPESPAHLWVKLDNGHEVSVSAAAVSIIELIEG